jgi:hypothetical protein
MNYIYESVQLLGGYNATARICGVTFRAVRKWVENGKLPRTEATRETHYAEMMAAADARIDAERLRATVYRAA